MNTVNFCLLRGVCQTPAYVAFAKGFFAEEDLDVRLHMAPTAWLIPDQILADEVQFAVIPWTRVAAAAAHAEGKAPLKLLCGSGYEEAALVVRGGLDPKDVKTVCVPREGGMKDLTAMGLVRTMAWQDVRLVRQPSGDGAIISLFGGGADAAAMVEPYASMFEALEKGAIVRRTGDLWPGVPGCSLTAASSLIERDPDTVRRVIRAFARGADFVLANPDETGRIAAPYIGIHPDHIVRALSVNRPNLHAVANADAMQHVLTLMQELGYIPHLPRAAYTELGMLEETLTDAAGSP